MTNEASRDLGQRLTQWKRVSNTRVDSLEKRRESEQEGRRKGKSNQSGELSDRNERPGPSQNRPEHYRIRPTNNEPPAKFNEETEF